MALAWCFPEEEDPFARQVLEWLRTARAVVPSIWHLEVANGLWVAERRRRLRPADAARFLALVEGLDLQVDPLTSSQALRETLALARKSSLAVYDAAYLELAMREGLPLATLDQGLRRAAVALGVSTRLAAIPKQS